MRRTVEGAQAHHILPQAEKFAKVFQKAGINVHDPRFGTWWEKGAHLRNAAAWNKKWDEFLSTDHTKKEILDFARKMADEYGLKRSF